MLSPTLQVKAPLDLYLGKYNSSFNLKMHFLTKCGDVRSKRRAGSEFWPLLTVGEIQDVPA